MNNGIKVTVAFKTGKLILILIFCMFSEPLAYINYVKNKSTAVKA